MVMIGRFSSDDPGWREPWDREPERANDDADWAGLDPRSKRVARRRSAQQKADLEQSPNRTKPDPATDRPT